MTKRTPKDETRLGHAGRSPEDHQGMVNVPVHRASTVLFPTVAAMREATTAPERMAYARQGTPSTFALQDAIAALEGGGESLVVPSGLAAITSALLAVTRPGDHILVADTVYEPTRLFCDGFLNEFGVETTYYDPAIGADIGGLFQANSAAIFLESPGSLTFEVQDVPAIAAAAKNAKSTREVVTILDNTWATPLFFKPLRFGVDISLQSITKYVGGHADLMMGSLTATRPLFQTLRRTIQRLGHAVSPDDCFLALRGLRTLSARLERHQRNGFELARWLEARPEVDRVLHPGLESFPGHDLWRRDFSGASGLFGIVLKPVPDEAVIAMLDSLHLFGLGYSWGGYESLILPLNLDGTRSAARHTEPGPLIRIHAGLEDSEDLIADLEAGLARV